MPISTAKKKVSEITIKMEDLEIDMKQIVNPFTDNEELCKTYLTFDSQLSNYKDIFVFQGVNIFKEFIDPFRSTSMFGSFSSHTLLSLDSSLASSYLIHHHFPVAF